MKIKNLFINKKKALSLLVAFGFALSNNSIGEKINITNSLQHFFIYDNTNYEKTYFDDLLRRFNAYSQMDDAWCKIPYKTTYIGGGGCGPLSIVNGISLAFDITSKEDIFMLLNNIIKVGDNCNKINDSLLNNSNNLLPVDNIKNTVDMAIYDGGKDSSSLLSYVKDNFNNHMHILGEMYFDDNGIENIISIIDYIYNANLDTNIILYHMTGGTLGLKRPFGSLSNSGHYVTLLINVKEFKEKNCVYLIDSLSRNIKGERDYPLNYPFVENSWHVGFKKFNEIYNTERINENIIKITSNETMNVNNMTLLRLTGGCGVIIGPNSITKNKTLKKGTK